jgi:ribosome-associated toxin RatA of RatAB toxin-antitoxin module
MEVRRLLLVAHPAERMYDLIEGAEHYPAFLPWCSAATILERSDHIVAARITVEVRGATFHFVTRNRKRRPLWMGISLEQGPFRQFEGEWNLTPFGDEGCRIDFALRYDFENLLLRKVAGAVFERITTTLVDAFVARADELGNRIPGVVPVAPSAGIPRIAPAGGPRSGDAPQDESPAAESPVPPDHGAQS